MTHTDSTGKPRKADRAYDHIRHLIVTLALEPGSVIDERQLIEQLGIGRTPVREAIQRLIHEGMITHTPRRGSWVSPLSFPELQYMIEARSIIEIECARRAAERMTTDQLDRLRAEVQESGPQIRAGDGFRSVVVDQFFHMELARATENRYLARMTEQLHHDLMRYWYVSAIQVGMLDIIVSDHLEIIAAIASGNADVAERAMEHHMTLFRERLRNMLASPEVVGIGLMSSGEHGC